MLDEAVQDLVEISHHQAVCLVICRGVDCRQSFQNLSEFPVPAGIPGSCIAVEVGVTPLQELCQNSDRPGAFAHQRVFCRADLILGPRIDQKDPASRKRYLLILHLNFYFSPEYVQKDELRLQIVFPGAHPLDMIADSCSPVHSIPPNLIIRFLAKDAKTGEAVCLPSMELCLQYYLTLCKVSSR